MADTTVSHPGSYSDQATLLRHAKMQVELELMGKRVVDLTEIIDKIFDGIARGEQVDLLYVDGTTRTITRAKKRGEKDPGEAE